MTWINILPMRDPGPEVEYLRTDFLVATGKFAEAKTKAQGLISSMGDKVNPRMYKMIAYVCDTLGDAACATAKHCYVFQQAGPCDAVTPLDYVLRAQYRS